MKVNYNTYVDFKKSKATSSGRIDHGRISQSRPRSTTKILGFTVDNLKKSAESLFTFYETVGNRIYGGRIPKEKVMEVFNQRVAEYLLLDADKLRERGKKTQYVNARQIVYYFAKKEGITHTACSEFYNQDHTTVIHSIAKIEHKLRTEDDFRKMMHELEHKLR